MPETTAGGPGGTGGTVLLVAGPATGGIGAHVASLATGLPALGWLPTVLTSPLTASRFDLGPRVVLGWPTGRTPGAVAALRRLITRADVVHAHGHQAGLLVTAVARTLPRSRRPPLVVSWHNALLPQVRLRSMLPALVAQRQQARWADLVTGASSDLVDTARRAGARHAQLAPVAAPTGKPARIGVGRPRADGRRRVLTVSRIAPQKNLLVVPQLAELVARDVPGLVWQLVGDGDHELRALLQAAIAETGAPVELLGARSDVPDLLAGAEVFVLPSLWEARSLAVQEAMAAGLPIVAQQVGGLPDLLGLDGKAGILTSFGDLDQMAASVSRILREPEFAAGLGAAARRRYDQLPTESDVIAAWAQTYRRLVEG